MTNLIILAFFFITLESAAQMFYPEFKDNIHSKSLSINKKRYFNKIYGIKQRISKHNDKTNLSDNIDGTIFIFGDSISEGYGQDYFDIWWVQLERFLKIRNLDYEIISIAGMGNNFLDNLENLVDVTNKAVTDKKNIKKIIYQFNYNDLQPQRSLDLKFSKSSKKKFNFDNFKNKFNIIREKHLNKSVFLRTAQHYAGVLTRNTKGTCEERGFDALGGYTWTYGSRAYLDDSKKSWQSFEANLIYLKNYLDNIGIEFEIIISPILFQIDLNGEHKFYNPYNLDFSCATIDPLEEIKRISSNKEIKIYDPTNYIKLQFENKISEGNFEPFFFPADDNHFTPIMSKYLAEYVATHWK